MVDAAVGDTPIPVEHAEELDRFAYGTFVQVPPGGTRTMTFQLEGSAGPAYDYWLTFAPQPLVNPDGLEVQVTGADGWEVCETSGLEQTDAGATMALPPEEDLTVTARFCRE